nr:tannase/feruloyl esterase family alpha/beta hydrolase [Sphingomonas quercus]
MRNLCLALALVAALLGLAPAEARSLPVVAPRMACADLARMVLADPAAPGRVETATVVGDKGAAPYCEVKGYVAPQVRFELHLPMRSWTQRLMFLGCGGFCGVVRLGPPRAAEGCRPLDAGEFALVTSDLGHVAGGIMDAVWAADRQAREDFGHRGVHVVTLAAKEIVRRFYGEPPAYAYFNGCSDGGREGVMAAARYPADFDAVIAGAPVVNLIANHTLFHAWALQHLRRPDGSFVFNDAALGQLHQAALDACDTDGGDPRDGVIPDPSRCAFDPGRLACGAAPCLSAEQVAVARAIYGGARDERGRPLYFGYPVGTELGWNRQAASVARWGAGSSAGYLASDPPDPNAELATLRFTAAAVRKLYAHADSFNITDPDLAAFQRRGGKLILWQGWADFNVASMSGVTLWKAIRARSGAGADGFVRLYMLPGVAHCGGGDGPDRTDLMSAIIAWREDGQPPRSITASRRGADGSLLATRTVEPYR